MNPLRSRTKGRRGISRSLPFVLPAALAAALMTACADAPQLPAASAVAPPAKAPSVAAVAHQVTVTDPKGDLLDHREREQVIRDVQAQGRGDAMKRQLGAM